MTPKISVIVTVYRRTQFLHQALQSVLDQTFRSFEIIVTDDSCNEDSTDVRAICDSFGSPHIRYRANPENLGVVLNLRAALVEARGELIAILNDDDAWEPDFLQKLSLSFEQDADCALAFSDHWIMSETGELDEEETNRNSALYGRDTLPAGRVADLVELVVEKNGVPLAMASLWSKSVVDMELLFKEVVGAYDFWIACLIAASQRPAYYVPERLTFYRIHSAMETGRKAPDKHENMVFIYEKISEFSLFPDRKRQITQGHGQYLYHVGKDCLFFDKISQSRTYLLKSFRVAPKLKPTLSLLASYLPRRLRVRLHFTR